MPASPDSVKISADGWQDKDIKCKMNVWLCYANLAVYSMCFWIQVNVLPFLIKEYGGGMKEFATVSTAFSVIQTFGSLYFGRIADRFGYKTALYIATLASAISYFCLGQATSLPLIVASKIPCVAQHAYQGSQVVIARSTSKAARPAAMARLSIAYGIGMIIGPKVGGMVQEALKEHATANVAGLFSVASLLLIFLMSNPSRGDIEMPSTKSETSVSSIKPQSQMSFSSMLRLPGVALLLTVKTAATLPGSSLQSIVPMLLLHMGADAVGSITSIGAVSAAFANFALVPYANKRLNSSVSENLRVACVLMAAGFFCFCIFNGGVQTKPCTTPQCTGNDSQALDATAFYYSLAACTIFLGLGGSILAACCSATLSGLVLPEQTGALLGLDMAISSATRALAPTVGGVVTSFLSVTWLGSAGLLGNLYLAFRLVGRVVDQGAAQSSAAVTKEKASDNALQQQ